MAASSRAEATDAEPSNLIFANEERRSLFVSE